MTSVLVIDNYDSFTWNLVHLIGPLTGSIDVVRNDWVTVEEIRDRAPDALVLSPGPCTPNQAIGQAFGGDVVRAPAPMHGKVSTIRHGASGIFRGLNDSFEATRYHSLVVNRANCPEALTVTADADGLIMGLEHASLPVHGVQFHPESIRSQHGTQILRNFLDLATAWNAKRDKRPAGVH